MFKNITKKCICCGKELVIKDGKTWKFLCSKCFRFIYYGLGLQVQPSELKNNFAVTMRSLYAQNAIHFPPHITEYLRQQAIIT